MQGDVSLPEALQATLRETRSLFETVLESYNQEIERSTRHTKETEKHLALALQGADGKESALSATLKNLEVETKRADSLELQRATLQRKIAETDRFLTAAQDDLRTREAELEVERGLRIAGETALCTLNETLAGVRQELAKTCEVVADRDLALAKSRSEAVKEAAALQATIKQLEDASSLLTERFEALKNHNTELEETIQKAAQLHREQQAEWLALTARDSAQRDELQRQLDDMEAQHTQSKEAWEAEAGDLRRTLGQTESKLQDQCLQTEESRRKLKAEQARAYNMEEKLDASVSKSKMESAVREQVALRQKVEQELQDTAARCEAAEERAAGLADRLRMAETKAGSGTLEHESLLKDAEQRRLSALRAAEKAEQRADDLARQLSASQREADELRAHVGRVTEGFQVAKTISRIRQTDPGKRAVGFDSLLNTVDSVVKTVDTISGASRADTGLIAAVRKGKR